MSNDTTKRALIVSMIEKAEQATDANDALKWSQAACNAANALCSLKSYETPRGVPHYG